MQLHGVKYIPTQYTNTVHDFRSKLHYDFFLIVLYILMGKQKLSMCNDLQLWVYGLRLIY